MIKITVIRKGDRIKTIECEGHSGYADEGSDIVCAGVSCLTQNAGNSLKEMLNIDVNYVIDENIPLIHIELPEGLDKDKSHDAQIILQSAYLGLKSLRDSYSKYISIKEKR